MTSSRFSMITCLVVLLAGCSLLLGCSAADPAQFARLSVQFNPGTPEIPVYATAARNR